MKFSTRKVQLSFTKSCLSITRSCAGTNFFFFWGGGGVRVGAGGDNSIEFINFGRVGDKNRRVEG